MKSAIIKEMKHIGKRRHLKVITGLCLYPLNVYSIKVFKFCGYCTVSQECVVLTTVCVYIHGVPVQNTSCTIMVHGDNLKPFSQ